MVNEWYFQKGDQRTGPVAANALRELAASGRITPDTLIWKTGLPNWIPAKSVKGLFNPSTDAPISWEEATAMADSVPVAPSPPRNPKPNGNHKPPSPGLLPFDSLVKKEHVNRQHLELLRSKTCYPIFRAVVAFSTAIMYLIAGIVPICVLGWVVNEFSNFTIVVGLLLGILLPVLIILLAKVAQEISSMVADIADATIDTAANGVVKS